MKTKRLNYDFDKVINAEGIYDIVFHQVQFPAAWNIIEIIELDSIHYGSTFVKTFPLADVFEM
jgi:hypothetical protein